MLWHIRLGHPSFLYMKRLYPSLFINQDANSFHCDICQLAKHTRSTYIPRPYTPSRPFHLVHSDIWGPTRIPNITGARWFLLFVDDHTRLSWTFLMKEKSETSYIFRMFYNMIKNQFNTSIQILKTDNARDFFNSNLSPYLQSLGVVHQSSCVDTPQQNGIAERKNRHILEVARSLLFQTNVPKQFWGEAVLTATYLINRMPSRVLTFESPIQYFQKHFPTSKLLTYVPPKIFGCTAFIHVYSQHRENLMLVL
ncbi:Retrovirus-related Pol polyprotein from transposon TNT 1-94 [Apostasia shenzhenica]|uniref:Retrovirus-related Pol polyprotein from transposon TNT 1-94 n=1 Tax=Apostasia shenzhenica TaxID=1088818 RepID=A0A2I0B6H1_9ASPA|nr:Retrovirus-related Pol polyprotein from transposon TNT 1-94 [Apostasia shenzhenica]